MNIGSDRPEPGKVYSLSAMMGAGKRWEDAEIKTSGLKIGQVVSYEDRANPKQEAVVIEAEGRMGQRCVFLEDGHQSSVSVTMVRTDEYCGWQMGNRVMNQEEIAVAVMFASKRRIEIEAERKAKADAKAIADTAEKARVLAAYTYLERIEGSKKSLHALAAANLKRELARVFPGVKFSVKSESYSMGDNVTASWTDGPVESEVQKICDKYQDHSFDGMDDSTHYNPTAWSETFGNTHHCNANRHESQALTQRAAIELGHTGPLTVDAYGTITGLGHEESQAIYRRARQLVG